MKLLLVFSLCLSSQLSSTFASSPDDFLDFVLQRSQILVQVQNMDPAQLGSYNLKILKNTVFNRDLKMKINETLLYGLRLGVTRAGICTRPADNSFKAGCNLNFNGVTITSKGTFKGDTIIAKEKEITITSTIEPPTLAYIEFSYKPPFLKKFAMFRMQTPFYLRHEYKAPEKLQLNADRKKDLFNEVNNQLNNKLGTFINSYYAIVLHDSMNG